MRGKARTRAQVAEITRLSYPTVLRAMMALGAQQHLDTYPPNYTIAEGAVGAAITQQPKVGRPAAGTAKADSVSSVFDPLRLDRWQHDVAATAADEWAKYRKVLIAGIDRIKLEQGVDPNELFKNLCGGAAIMASFALAIQPHLDDPLWHEKISSGKLSKSKLHLVENDGLDAEND